MNENKKPAKSMNKIEILKEYNNIPYEWLVNNYSDIKEDLGFGYSDDKVNIITDKDMSDKEFLLLQKEIIKRYKKRC